MAEVEPTIMNGVPRFLKRSTTGFKLEFATCLKPSNISFVGHWLWAKKRLLFNERLRNHGEIDGDELVTRFYGGEAKVADHLVFSRIRRGFGGRVRFMTSGAAPLAPDMHLFFETIGLPVIEGYGLTETAAPICGNTPRANRRGTVGKPLPGVEVKLAADGEILLKGPQVFVGYYKNKEATDEVLKDGWFSTSNIGEFDEDGYLRIVDRKRTSSLPPAASTWPRNFWKISLSGRD